MTDKPLGWDVEIMEGVVVMDVEDNGTEHVMSVTVDAKNMPSVRLLGVELLALRDDMRVGASPFAERLERIIGRFVASDEDPDQPERIVEEDPE